MSEPQQNWDEHVAVTGRPQDEPAPNTTFAERSAARKKRGGKAVQADEVENKAVSVARPARKRK